MTAQPFPRPHLGTLKRAALWVAIDHCDALTLARPDAGEMQRQRRLADPVLLVEESDNHGSRF